MAKRSCSVDGCSEPVQGRGWCSRHYQRWQRHGDPETIQTLWGRSPLERFEHYIDCTTSQDGCWLWRGGRSPRGYGRFKVSGKTLRAHRWAYEQFVGPIPADLRVCHRCDNPPCCNPDHLFLGTDADNVHDCVAKGRARGGSNSQWQKLSPEICIAIQEEYEGRWGEQAKLAARYGVSPSVISEVLKKAGLGYSRATCAKGHPFDSDNTYISPTGKKQCRQCRRDWRAGRSKRG